MVVDGPEGEAELPTRALAGIGEFEVACEPQRKGAHTISFLLCGQHIQKSPVSFIVVSGPPVGSKSRLHPPAEAIVNMPAKLLLDAFDKFGNKLGATVCSAAHMRWRVALACMLWNT